MSASSFWVMNLIERTLHCNRFYGIRSYSSGRVVRNSLYARLSPLGNPNISLAPELDRWADKGKKVSVGELNRIIRDLRKRRRFAQALEVSEWMGTKGICKLTASDNAVRLDLTGRVRGLVAAESYFSNMNEKDKNEKIYGALLNCYVREQLVDKSISHMEKMKELGLASGALPYNDLMCLYTKTRQYEKIPELLAEMKEINVVPDNFSYRICINSYGARSDIEGMEKVLQEMEDQTHFLMDWNTYSVVANNYIKAKLTDKAISALKKSEKLLRPSDGEGYNHLISLYGSLGNKSEVQRLWELKKSVRKVINIDYITMLGSLVRLRELEDAESLLKEWESSGTNFDFRVPDVLILGYCQRGMMEKAEAMIEGYLKKGKIPIPNSFAILSTAFEGKGEMRKAMEYMMRAISSFPGNEGWKPNKIVIKSVLGWLGNEGKVEETEAFVRLLSAVIPMDIDMYHAMLKANILGGKEVGEILESMKADNIEPNDDTKTILCLR